MPELPEVEVTRLSFAARIEGAGVGAVRLGKPLRWPLGCEPEALVGKVVGAVRRRGKYLWLPLSHPDHARQENSPGLLMHLGMSGSLQFSRQLPALGPHDHFELQTTQGCLRLTDPRRFGAVVWSPALNQGVAAKLLAGLGMEPFDPGFNGQVLHAGLQGRRVAVKQALLGGQIVVGAGNIYACEALFQAGIDPRTRSDRISRPRAQRLAQAVQQTLARALELGGSTLRDFVDAHGMAGAFQTQAQVYGREGQPCHVCATPIKRLVQGQRSTFYCPSCQRR
ncbi:MAG: bifunctional DNA-formamidopyrimidine glycosylase/DNA-(apurinic or apyrimidinic site) lyase [Burkholderiales bacterium]